MGLKKVAATAVAVLLVLLFMWLHFVDDAPSEVVLATTVLAGAAVTRARG